MHFDSIEIVRKQLSTQNKTLRDLADKYSHLETNNKQLEERNRQLEEQLRVSQREKEELRKEL